MYINLIATEVCDHTALSFVNLMNLNPFMYVYGSKQINHTLLLSLVLLLSSIYWHESFLSNCRSFIAFMTVLFSHLTRSFQEDRDIKERLDCIVLISFYSHQRSCSLDSVILRFWVNQKLSNQCNVAGKIFHLWKFLCFFSHAISLAWPWVTKRSISSL